MICTSNTPLKQGTFSVIKTEKDLLLEEAASIMRLADIYRPNKEIYIALKFLIENKHLDYFTLHFELMSYLYSHKYSYKSFKKKKVTQMLIELLQINNNENKL